MDDFGDIARYGDDVSVARKVCGANSFSAETPVATSDGDVPISDIEIGDTVLAYHEDLDETGEYIVTDTISTNETAQDIMDVLNICPEGLADGIRSLTGGLDDLVNHIADSVAPVAEAIAEIAVAEAVTHVVGAAAVVAGVGGLSAAIISGMAGRVASNLWAGRDRYKCHNMPSKDKIAHRDW